MTRTVLALAIALFGLQLSFSAHAERARRVVLVVDQQSPGIIGRLRAEFESLGFAVVLAKPSKVALPDQAKAADAEVVVRVNAKRTGVEVWVSDASTTKTAIRDEVLPASGQTSDDGVIALRAVELVRAAFLEIDVQLPEPVALPPVEAPAAPPDAVPSPPKTDPKPPSTSAVAGPARRPEVKPRAPAQARARARTWALELGPGLGLESGGAGKSGSLLAGVRHAPLRQLWFGAAAAIPLLSPSTRGSEGEATLSWGMAALDANVDLVRGRRVTPRLGVAGGVFWLRASGRASAGFDDQTETAFAGAVLGRAALDFSLSEPFGIVVDGRVGLLSRRQSVRFVERTEAEFGPLVAWASVLGRLSL